MAIVANAARGEVLLEAGTEQLVVCFGMGAVAELQAETGEMSLLKMVLRLQALDIGLMLKALPRLAVAGKGDPTEFVAALKPQHLLGVAGGLVEALSPRLPDDEAAETDPPTPHGTDGSPGASGGASRQLN